MRLVHNTKEFLPQFQKRTGPSLLSTPGTLSQVLKAFINPSPLPQAGPAILGLVAALHADPSDAFRDSEFTPMSIYKQGCGYLSLHLHHSRGHVRRHFSLHHWLLLLWTGRLVIPSYMKPCYAWLIRDDLPVDLHNTNDHRRTAAGWQGR